VERDRPKPPAQETSRAEARDAAQAVLERLRRVPSTGGPAPTATEVATGGMGFGASDPSYRGSPRARLGSARAALEAGRIDEARTMLEQAQLQLVFRPVTPAGEPAPGASRAAGEVAGALSMLGAGDRGNALRYIDRAMGETGSVGSPPLSQPYGYAGPPPGYGR